MNEYQALVQWHTGERKYSERKLSQFHFVHTNPTDWSGEETDTQGRNFVNFR
jgi:hypothetical protein